MYILYIILVGLVAGWATGKIMKGSGYGVLTDILLGIAGAIIWKPLARITWHLQQRRHCSQHFDRNRGSGIPRGSGSHAETSVNVGPDNSRTQI
jgi:uncharacterized membrane protein YeaQ/YmgE (transglycosylase-associated protein family)